MQVPSFLLRRLYVKGSLRNQDGGCAFDLQNSLGSGYADQVLPLLIDGEAIDKSRCAFVVDGGAIPFDKITSNDPMTLAMNRDLTVTVSGLTLAPGEHTIEMAFLVTGMGEMHFEVKDIIDA
jgi:hydroxymethylglutaryl-CoA reductase (NADPH)